MCEKCGEAMKMLEDVGATKEQIETIVWSLTPFPFGNIKDNVEELCNLAKDIGVVAAMNKMLKEQEEISC